jgi:hypothetical protein
MVRQRQVDVHHESSPTMRLPTNQTSGSRRRSAGSGPVHPDNAALTQFAFTKFASEVMSHLFVERKNYLINRNVLAGGATLGCSGSNWGPG